MANQIRRQAEVGLTRVDIVLLVGVLQLHGPD